ncbi:OOP family OmpA-OmpF porin [Dysgonomonadaceae bacterium PH5-43]|nr:OOP family OmpA-OmpF porin [Dysgonomonadaceae bacterium PH5-43]
MKNFNLLLIAVLLGFATTLVAQNKERPWAVSLYGVKTEYLGDMRTYSHIGSTSNWFNYTKNTIFNFDQFYGGGGLSVDRYLSRFFDLGIYGSYGTIGYDLYDDGSFTHRNFDANVASAKLQTRIKFLGMDDCAVVPYISIGVGGLAYFDVSSKVNANGNYFTGYQGENLPFSKQEYSGDNPGFAGIVTGGLGLEVRLSKVVSLRYQADFGWTTSDKYDMFKNGNGKDMQLQHNVGISFAFGKGKRDRDKDGVYDDVDRCLGTPFGVTVDEFGCPVDSDGDGVADYLDKCPDTPRGAKVDANGCPVDSDGDGVADYLDKCPNTPAGVKVDANGCPVDSDGDGVADYLDKCPNTPAGVKVDANGCPVDSDGDGVADYLDKCPNTPAGVKVDANGCPLIPELDEKVLFDTGKSVIKSEANPTLDKVVELLNANSELKIKINGHTDNTGSERLNSKLSINRAKAVEKYLVDKGISQDRISTEGFGYSKPISDNSTTEGRSQNRRVEIVWNN